MAFAATILLLPAGHLPEVPIFLRRSRTAASSLELRPRYNWLDESNNYEKAPRAVTMRAPCWAGSPRPVLRRAREARGDRTHRISVRSNFNDDPSQIGHFALPAAARSALHRREPGLIEYARLRLQRMKLGRQVVRLDNQRWVSDNDFRQVPQLFEGAASPTRDSKAPRSTRGTTGGAQYVGRHSTTCALRRCAPRGIPFEGQSVAAYAVLHDQARTARSRASRTTRIA